MRRASMWTVGAGVAIQVVLITVAAYGCFKVVSAFADYSFERVTGIPDMPITLEDMTNEDNH